MNKIVIAITGASGSIYAKVLLEKLLSIPEQWAELSVILKLSEFCDISVTRNIVFLFFSLSCD